MVSGSLAATKCGVMLHLFLQCTFVHYGLFFKVLTTLIIFRLLIIRIINHRVINAIFRIFCKNLYLRCEVLTRYRSPVSRP